MKDQNTLNNNSISKGDNVNGQVVTTEYIDPTVSSATLSNVCNMSQHPGSPLLSSLASNGHQSSTGHMMAPPVSAHVRMTPPLPRGTQSPGGIHLQATPSPHSGVHTPVAQSPHSGIKSPFSPSPHSRIYAPVVNSPHSGMKLPCSPPSSGDQTLVAPSPVSSPHSMPTTLPANNTSRRDRAKAKDKDLFNL